MTKLLLYIGQENYTGIFQDSSDNIKRKFMEADPEIEAIEVTAKQLLDNIKETDQKEFGWEKKTIVVFPGGQPTLWESQLENKIKMLREFVLRGGNMFLVCAGAYFAMKSTTFVFNAHSILNKDRDLSLFPGKGIGPINPKTLNITEPKALGSHIVVRDASTGEKANMYFKEGGYFELNTNAEEARNFKTLHTYMDGKIASGIIKLGAGRAIMCFFHPEYDFTPNFQHSDVSTKTFFEKLQSKLNKSFSYRNKFYQNCLELLIKRKIDDGNPA